MKYKILISFIIGFVLTGSLSANEQSENSLPENNKLDVIVIGSPGKFVQDFPCIANLPKEPLSKLEKEGLVFMREEEKLARDVYTILSDKYSIPAFKNISKSEQRHTDAVLHLLTKYDIDDPVKTDQVGVFVNQDLQSLYDTLLLRGSKDLVSALMVGALIEETDILDLEKELSEVVDNQDITQVYTNLLRGSHNHLKAFVNIMKMHNIIYKPQLLNQAHFDSIFNPN